VADVGGLGTIGCGPAVANLAAGPLLDAEPGGAIGVEVARVADRAQLGRLGAAHSERGADRGERAAGEGFEDAAAGLLMPLGLADLLLSAG